jgi:hypothetical protein
VKLKHVIASSILAVAAAGLAACSNSLPGAAAMAAADGYPASGSGASAQQATALLGRGADNFGTNVDSAATGRNAVSGHEEVVLILSQSGTGRLTGRTSEQLTSERPAGVTAFLDGNVVRLSGSETAMNAAFGKTRR